VAEALIVLVVLPAAIAIYLLPAFVAGTRNHNNALAIFWLNFFLGWSFLGWVAALVWACTDNVRQHPTGKIETKRAEFIPRVEEPLPQHRSSRMKPYYEPPLSSLGIGRD
jgi:hypothetical protein